MKKQNILKAAFHELYIFILKQAWACLFGGLMLFAIIVSSYIEWTAFHRYDFLFFYALTIQFFLIVFKLESISEAKVIFLFHIVGTIMEIFKTSSSIASWNYPETSLFRIGNVPLFSGFMYSSVGSYIARSQHIMKLRYTYYPQRIWTIILASGIYINFFTHHFVPDIRFFLFLGTLYIFRKTKVFFTITTKERSIPLLFAFFLISLFIWLAENIGTFSKVWLYPTQENEWHMVSFTKLGSWFLLMIISFVMVKIMHDSRKKHMSGSS